MNLTKYRISSDWHLPFYSKKNSYFFLDKMEDDSEQILILAGDCFDCFTPDTHILEELSDRFKMIYYVLGNHDFYGATYTQAKKFLNAKLEKYPNIVLLDNSGIDNIIGTTLWTDYDKNSENAKFYAERGMLDFAEIVDFTADFVYNIHIEELNYLKTSMDSTSIVVTHHLPTYKSIHPKYKNSPLNAAFASNLDDLILTIKPKLWVHGHTHENFDYVLGNTRIICNPFGYPGENRNYNKQLVVEL